MIELDFYSFTLAFSLVSFLLEIVLDTRQYYKFKIKVIPEYLLGIIDDNTFKKSQAYGRDRSLFGIFETSFQFALNITLLHFQVHCFLWDFTLIAIRQVGLTGDWPILRAILSALIASLFETVVGIPLSLFSTFIIEEKHGFNKMTLKVRISSDVAKAFIIETVIIIPIITAVVWMLRTTGSAYWIYVFLFILIIRLLLSVVYPTLIAPLFNTFKPLEEGELREKIEQICHNVSFPFSNIYVLDGSLRSSHSNAALVGLFRTKRIWLYDTLLEKISSVEDISAVIGHELGHWMHWDMWKHFLVSNSYLLAVLYCFKAFDNESIVKNFGFRQYDVFIALMLYFTAIIPPFNLLFSFLMNIFFRKIEFDADAFAVKLGFDLSAALIALHKENLSTMIYDKWYALFHNSHPTLVERLDRLGYAGKRQEQLEKKEK